MRFFHGPGSVVFPRLPRSRGRPCCFKTSGERDGRLQSRDKEVRKRRDGTKSSEMDAVVYTNRETSMCDEGEQDGKRLLQLGTNTPPP